MPDETILVVEDDPTMQRVIKDNLQFKGYAVRTASDGEEGLNAALELRPDLILLDIMLPKINGYEVCRIIREEGLDTPVIMLTAKGEESDIVLGLNLGADDYVTKPFGVNELLARVNACLRRQRQDQPDEAIVFGPLTLDLASHRLTRDGKEIALTPKEFGVLAHLVSRPGRVQTRDQVLRAVWGYSVFVTPRSVDRCITALRDKLRARKGDPDYIVTIRGVGYRFDPPDA